MLEWHKYSVQTCSTCCTCDCDSTKSDCKIQRHNFFISQPKIWWPDTVLLPKSPVTGVFSELRMACLRADFVELIQSCRTDTDLIYCSVSDPLLKSSVAFLDTDLDQIGSSSNSKHGYVSLRHSAAVVQWSSNFLKFSLHREAVSLLLTSLFSSILD